MIGIIEEGEELIRTDTELEALEAVLICFAQRLEHYEITSYSTARAHSRQIGFIKVAEILGLTIEEEKQNDRRLTA